MSSHVLQIEANYFHVDEDSGTRERCMENLIEWNIMNGIISLEGDGKCRCGCI